MNDSFQMHGKGARWLHFTSVSSGLRHTMEAFRNDDSPLTMKYGPNYLYSAHKLRAWLSKVLRTPKPLEWLGHAQPGQSVLPPQFTLHRRIPCMGAGPIVSPEFAGNAVFCVAAFWASNHLKIFL